MAMFTMESFMDERIDIYVCYSKNRCTKAREDRELPVGEHSPLFSASSECMRACVHVAGQVGVNLHEFLGWQLSRRDHLPARAFVIGISARELSWTRFRYLSSPYSPAPLRGLIPSLALACHFPDRQQNLEGVRHT